MPIYEYRCLLCRHVTEALRTVDQRDDPAKCEECGGGAKRKFSLCSVPAKWREYFDWGLGRKIGKMEDINRAVKDAKYPTPFLSRRPSDGATVQLELPGRNLVNTGGTQRGSVEPDLDAIDHFWDAKAKRTAAAKAAQAAIGGAGATEIPEHLVSAGG